jgi:hypothetical protein
MIFESQKVGVNLGAVQKLNLASWTAFTLLYRKYILYTHSARVIYKLYKKIKDRIKLWI